MEKVALPDFVAESAEELLSSPLTPTKWFIDQIVPVGSVDLIVGPAKSGKSRVMYRLAVAVAEGKDFLEYKNLVGPKRVLYIDHEHSRDIRHRRLLECIDPAKGIPKNLSIYGRPSPKINIAKDRARFLKLCAEYDFIVLDNVLSTPGFYHDMKDNVAAAETIELIEAAVIERGGAFFMVAHPPKSFIRDIHKMGLEELEDLPEDFWTGAALGPTAIFALADVRMLLLSDIRQRHTERGYKLLFVGGKSPDESSAIPLVLTKERGLIRRPSRGRPPKNENYRDWLSKEVERPEPRNDKPWPAGLVTNP
jgi:hypothetical protein